MIKKAVLLGGGLVVGLVLLGSGAASYIRTSAGCLRETVENSVPIDFQIQRARNMIQDLVPEVRKNMHLIAKEEVEVQRLEEQIARSEETLKKEKEQLLRLKTDLAGGKNAIQYGDRSYSIDEVKHDLAHRFERYKTGDATLVSLKQIRNAREKSLAAAREQLEGMLAAKRQLQVDVENLEARTKMVEVAQTTSKYQFDETRLGQVKELISNLRTRLAVAEKLVNAEVNFEEEIPVDKPAPANIAEQVGDYFGDKAGDLRVAKK